MGDLKNPRLIYLKGGLFLLLGVSAVILALMKHPSWELAALLVLAIWAFARLYYFMFYVIEHYVDPQYKFAGVVAFLRYLVSKRTADGASHESGE
jgi:hypothetical protein